jgi:hypothetical protein
MSECVICGWEDKPCWSQDWPVPHKVCSDSCLDSLNEKIERLEDDE